MSSQNDAIDFLNPEASGRYLCDILKNMRQCYKTRNFSHLPGLIEEAQYRAERMENAMERYGYGFDGLKEMNDKRDKLKKEIEELKKERDALEDEIDSDEDKKPKSPSRRLSRF